MPTEEELVEQVILQISEYHKHGFEVLGIIGINRSPCCGVDTTSDDDRELDGRGFLVVTFSLKRKVCLAGEGFGRMGDFGSVQFTLKRIVCQQATVQCGGQFFY